MAMNFIKGLIGGQDQYAQPGQVMNPYALPPGAQQPGQPGAQGQSSFMSPEAFAQQQQAAYGTPPVGGAPAQPSPYGVGQQSPAAHTTGGVAGQLAQSAAAPAAAGAPEARIAELQRDLEAMALFARTLLTILEEKKVLTRAEFQEVHNRLDMLDGKLDNRISDGK